MVPWSDSQPFQRTPFHHLCHTAWSVSCTTTSIRSGPQETPPGEELRTPPSGSHPAQLPANQRCQSWLSVPRAKTSNLPVDQEVTTGAEVRAPPRPSHPLQVV